MARLIGATLLPRFAAGLNATGGGIKVIKKTRVRERVRIMSADMGAARMLVLAIVCVLSLPDISSAQQVKLKAALQVPVSELFIGQSLAQFKKEVEERTANAISIEIFDDGKPYNDAQIVGAVTSGAMQLGVAGFNQFADKIPAVDIIEQPFLFNFDALINAAFAPAGEIRGMIEKALLDTMGVRVLWWQPVGNQVFFSKGRDVAGPQQIKGRKVRVFSDTMAKFVKLCGGEPTILTSGAIHGALQDGKVDMAMAAISTVINRELWKVSDTITRTAHAPVEYLLFVNEKSWQALAPAHRTAIMEIAKTLEPKVREKAAQTELAAYAFAREKGMRIVELLPHQVAEWRACSSDLVLGYMESTADLGTRLMAAYGRLRTAPCCSAGPESAGRPSITGDKK